jgi:hypothetical protein
MPERTYRSWLVANARESGPWGLETYLSEDARREGWTTEFKASATNADYGVREAVASLSNHSGGEVFVGVDNGGRVTGSEVREEALNETLRQVRASRADWRITNLLDVTAKLTPVQLPSRRKWAYVIEVKPYDRPAFVLDDGGDLRLPVRSGSDTKTLDTATAIEWYARRRRGQVLRSCYRELETFSLQLSQYRMFPEMLPDPLPYVQSTIQSGLAYEVLTKADRAALFGAGIANGRASGAVDIYYTTVRRVRALLPRLPEPNRNMSLKDLPGVGFEFSNLEEDLRQRLKMLGDHISREGFRRDAGGPGASGV